jgi:hypothetical protein
MTITLTREEVQQVLDALGSCDTDYVFDGEDERPVDSYDEEKVGTAYRLLRARLSAPEPEPHGYLWFTRYMEQRFTHRKPGENERIGDVKPVYTTPPQREWQGLTDEERKEVLGSLTVRVTGHLQGTASTADYAKAIEAKLREKNGG